MKKRPKAVAFDVIGTLFPIEPLRERLNEAGVAGERLELWFSLILQNAFALEVTGEYRSFKEIAEAAFEQLWANAGRAPDASAASRVIESLVELPPRSEAARAIEMLFESGLRLLTLTNGGAQTTRQMLARCRLEGFFERVISVEEARHWKPSARVYRHAAQAMELAPDEVGLVAAHAWDIHGAARAGLTTAWVASAESVFPSFMTRPTVQGGNLVEASQALLDLPKA